MNKVIEVLKSLAGKLDGFDDPVPENCPIPMPPTKHNNFEKNLYLKDNLSQVLKDDAELKHHYWIIQEWGGIRSFKRNERNDMKLRKFKLQLTEGALTEDTASVISSLSKVASFLYPDKFVIYDSRAVYALNWLILRYADDNKKRLFPQPPGRNKELDKYDIQTIFRLSQEKRKKDGSEYHDEKTAYFEYCKIIVELSKHVFPNRKPYYLEMLLFVIAPGYIVDDIKKSVSLSIR